MCSGEKEIDLLKNAAIKALFLVDIPGNPTPEQSANIANLKAKIGFVDIVTTKQGADTAYCSASLRLETKTYADRFEYKIDRTDDGKFLVTESGI